MPVKVTTDYQLWERLKNCNHTAFENFYYKYDDWLYSFESVYSNDQKPIKDPIPDPIVDLYKYYKKLDPRINLKRSLPKSLTQHLKRTEKVEVHCTGKQRAYSCSETKHQSR